MKKEYLVPNLTVGTFSVDNVLGESTQFVPGNNELPIDPIFDTISEEG